MDSVKSPNKLGEVGMGDVLRAREQELGICTRRIYYDLQGDNLRGDGHLKLL